MNQLGFDILYGKGAFDLGVYFAVFVIALVPFNVKNWSLRGVIFPILITMIFYFSPCTISIAVLLLVMWIIQRSQWQEEVRPVGRISYTHEFFGDNKHTGWKVQNLNDFQYLGPYSAGIPQALRDAAHKAVEIYPYLHNGDVIVETEVEIRRGKPVIIDSIVTAKQIQSMMERGAWDQAEAYVPRGNVNIISGDLEQYTDSDGRILFPSPANLENQFLSQFNGPDLTRRIRK